MIHPKRSRYGRIRKMSAKAQEAVVHEFAWVCAQALQRRDAIDLNEICWEHQFLVDSLTDAEDMARYQESL